MQILAATDFSDRADRAIRRAALLASGFSANLILTHVVEGSQPENFVRAMRDLAATELGATAESIAQSYGIAPDVRIVDGDAFDAIVSLARDCSADLIVLGTHRRALLKDVFVGTTVERVVRACVAPVLVTNVDEPSSYKSVLVAVDFSDCSAEALVAARRLGFLAATRVTIIHISNPSDVVQSGIPAEEVAARVSAGALKSSQALARFLGALDLDDVEYSMRVRPDEGPPGMAIKEVAEELGADLVVIGTQGRNRAIRTLLGSVTDDLLKTLAADTLVIPCRRASL
jgi:nucleotide-binding universal stress UspA family protein